jgi:hypothetical protein
MDVLVSVIQTDLLVRVLLEITLDALAPVYVVQNRDPVTRMGVRVRMLLVVLLESVLLETTMDALVRVFVALQMVHVVVMAATARTGSVQLEIIRDVPVTEWDRNIYHFFC